MHYPDHLIQLIDTLRKLPGVGTKTAERYAFQIISWSKEALCEMAQTIEHVNNKLETCQTCQALINPGRCPFCDNIEREAHKLCIVASPKEVFLIEETHTFKGRYHVLGALLSPLDGHSPARLAPEKIKSRIQNESIEEVILALDATLEGDATALYLTQELKELDIEITRLALGLPIGTALDFIDGGTLARALTSRKTVNS